MSKTSSKQRYEQLKEWLSTRGVQKNIKKPNSNSRLEYYSEKKVQ
jgi:hypothetical protein